MIDGERLTMRWRLFPAASIAQLAWLGLVNYWMTSGHWPDCVEEVAPHYDFKAECARVAAGPPLPPAT